MAVDYTHHDNETMQKVWTGMRRAGLKDDQLIDVANAIMNQGILFREPLKSMGAIIPNDPPPSSRRAWDMAFCVVENCGHEQYRHEDKSGYDGYEGDGKCYVSGCPCMFGRYMPTGRRPLRTTSDVLTDGHPYADEVSFSEFIRLLKGTKGNDWAILPDGDFRLLLHTFERKYKSALPRRQVDFTMFVFTVMRIMEEKGKPWITVK